MQSLNNMPVRYVCIFTLCLRIRGRSVQLPYNRVYYRSLKSAAVRCCYSELGPFFALCSLLLPAFTSIHASSSYSSPTKTSERNCISCTLLPLYAPAVFIHYVCINLYSVFVFYYIICVVLSTSGDQCCYSRTDFYSGIHCVQSDVH